MTPMLRLTPRVLLVPIAATFFATVVACGDDSPRRAVQITQTDTNCVPTQVDATQGEKIRFEVKNDGKKDAEIEGIEGMNLEELLIPSGKTRNQSYTAPGKSGIQKVKCYVPGGQSTIIQIK